MSNLIFLLALYLLQILRLLLSVIFFIIPHSRKYFENKNLQDAACQSFSNQKIIADFCFEVSSEGELEQVRPLFLYYLEQNKYLELIFASPSVEKKCVELQKIYSKQIRILRMPLVTGQLVKNWITAPVIIFCRYDFFPELLLLKFLNKKFVLLSGAVKKSSWFKHHVFNLFDIIVAATTKEERHFKQINSKAITFAFDFRIERITERWKNSSKLLAETLELKKYLELLQDIPKENRLIVGSAWESDLAIFSGPQFIELIKNSKIHILIVPHQLTEQSIKAIHTYFFKLGLGDYLSVLGDDRALTPIMILNKSGVLCELYSLFSNAYVGGGYERSIHSVFEPFFSGAQVYVGPKIYRSTEYDFLVEMAPEEIHVLINPEQFYNIYMKSKNKDLNQELRNFWRNGATFKIAEIAAAIGQVNNAK